MFADFDIALPWCPAFASGDLFMPKSFPVLTPPVRISEPKLLYHANQDESIVNNVDAGLWGVVELNLWVLVASIPTLRPLIGKVVRDRKEASKKTGSSRTYELSSSQRTLRMKFSRSKPSSIPSSDSRDPLPIEGYKIHGPSQDSERQ